MKLFILVVLAVLNSVNVAVAQSAGDIINLSEPPGIALEPWTGGDKPYQQIEKDILKEMAAGQKPEALVKKYRLASTSYYVDPQAVFRWAFASFRASLAAPSDFVNSNVADSSEAMEETISPHTYSFSRLRFLIAAADFPSSDLRDWGERLLKHDPQDYLVKFYLIQILDVDVPSQRREALAYAHDQVRARPKDYSVYGNLAGLYYQLWLSSHKDADKKTAIAAYQKSISLTPPGNPFRNVARTIINQMNGKS